MAEKYGVSITDFLLAWTINQGISVLPRSHNPEHVKANFAKKNIKISDKDIEFVKLSEVHKYCWDPLAIA